MKSNPKRPQAIPFQRGKKPARTAPIAPGNAVWIELKVWNAFAAEETEAHRLASGPEAWLERFGYDLLLSYQTERGKEAILAELDYRCGGYSFHPQRVFGKYLPHHASERGAPLLLRGEEGNSLETEIREAGVRYGLDFAIGYSAGLFIDQRANRTRVYDLKPKRLLNTFAYTCSFSVVAALAGAETVSIDLSRRSLTRGEENFRRNGLDSKVGHRFITDDVLAVLPRLARRGEKFDVIIVDPPTFSRNQAGAAFQVRRDFDQLITLALEVAAPGAKILLSVNHSAMQVVDLEHSGRQALRMLGRSGRFNHTPPLPDFPPGEGARTIWMEMT
jgi:23S rRNA (cytosine1962-C5)-methyltransferase